MMAGLRTAARRGLRRLGLDVVSYPRWNTTPWGLQRLLPQLGVDCILDVGGHFGEYGAVLRETGYRGHIVSFEPVPENFARLEERSAGDPRWTIHPYALGAEDGELKMNVTRGTEFASFLEPNEATADEYTEAMRISRVQALPVRRLDRVIDEVTAHLRRPTLFLKCDTQGYDLQVMEGAGDRVVELAGLQSELPVKPLYHGMPTLTDAMGRYESLGFELFGLYPVNQDGTGRVIEFDCVMRRR